MFNFCEVFVSRAMVTDAGSANTCRCIFKAPSLQTKSTETEGPSENMGFNGKTVCRFQTKKKRTETLFSTFQKNPVEHKDPKSIN